MDLWPVYSDGYSECREAPCFTQRHSVEMGIDRSGTDRSEILEEIRVVAKEIVSTDKKVVHVILPDIRMAYAPGDSLLLQVSNDAEKVSCLAARLGACPNDSLAFARVHKKTGKQVFRFEGSLKTYLAGFLDITSLPAKYALHVMAQHARKEKDRLAYLASKEGRNDYFGLLRNWNTLLDIFEQFDVHMPLRAFLEIATEIKPRAFSLISRIGEPVEFVARVVEKTCRVTDTARYGHFSGFLLRIARTQHKAHLIPGRTERTSYSVPDVCGELVYGVSLKPNRLIRMQRTPCVMAGMGTGISPFISFLRNWSEQKSTVFYGCRSSEENLLLEIMGEEMQAHAPAEADTDNLRAETFVVDQTEIYVVYSREGPGVHMGQFLASHKPLFQQRLGKTRRIYICGPKPAQKETREIFSEICPGAEIGVDEW